MGDQTDREALRARVEELDAENRKLKDEQTGRDAAEKKPLKARVRTSAAIALVLIGALLAPVAVLGTWARAQLVDTDRFVQTFAPLAQKPAVQRFVVKEVTSGIEQSVDIDALVGDLFAGIAELNLPPTAERTLPMLEGSAAEGVRSLIGSGVETVVESPQFANVWQVTLRETHSRAIAVIQGDPNALLQLSDDGTLSLSLAAVISEVKTRLTDQGVGFAESIPVIDRSVPILASSSLALIRTLYQLVVAIGYWLPWVALGALMAGVLLARNRTRALAWAGGATAASLLLLAGGMGIGKLVFIGGVSPSIMPAATAEVIFVQLTELIASTLLALITLFLLVMLGAWFAGASHRAVALRGLFDSGFAAARRATDRRGLSTGALGRFLDRWRSALGGAAVAIGVLVLFLVRPITFGGVLSTLLCVVALLCLIELLRRPEREVADPLAQSETEGEVPAETVVVRAELVDQNAEAADNAALHTRHVERIGGGTAEGDGLAVTVNVYIERL